MDCYFRSDSFSRARHYRDLMIELRHNSGITIVVGPLLEKQAQGYPIVPITGAELTWFWWGYLVQADGTVVDIATRIWADIPGCDGLYSLTLTADDTNQMGSLTLYIHDDWSLGKPIMRQYNVIDANVWDARYASKLAAVDSRHAQKG